MTSPRLKVLFIEDDEDDYILVRDLLSEVTFTRYNLEWISNYDQALEAMEGNKYDIYLLDYRLGGRTGLELLRHAVEKGCRAPIIFLTGQGDYEIDLEAMKAGAADYLIKHQINAPLLERSIRYAVERKRTEEALRESERRLRLLSTQLLKAQEEERKKIARELHDSIGSSLSAFKFNVEHILSQMERGEAVSDSLRILISMNQNAIEECRRIMTNLRPSILDDLGIVTTLEWYCREFENTHSSVRITKEIAIREEEVSEPLKIVIFRVMQEAFHNIAKHSQAKNVKLFLTHKNGAIQLMIEDDGVGFDLNSIYSRDSQKRGLGLASMKERTELSGGSFEIDSAAKRGTAIRLSWKCTESF